MKTKMFINFIKDKEVGLDSLYSAMESAMKEIIASKKETFSHLVGKLDALSPLQVISRGYSVATDESGKIVRRTTDVKSDDLITIQLLINGIMKNDFQSWRELGSIPDTEPLKSLFVRLGYSREDIANMLKEF